LLSVIDSLVYRPALAESEMRGVLELVVVLEEGKSVVPPAAFGRVEASATLAVYGTAEAVPL
jgi:hypothetical protein